MRALLLVMCLILALSACSIRRSAPPAPVVAPCPANPVPQELLLRPEPPIPLTRDSWRE